MENKLEELAKRFSKERKPTYYQEWVKREGLRIIEGHYIYDLRDVELDPWERRGGSAVFINHEDSHNSNDCYVCEIPPGGELKPQRQLYEEMIYVLDGQGTTRVWNDSGGKVSFEWHSGSLFAIPLNSWHEHFNTSGKKPARFISVTNMPMVMNIFEDDDFIFKTGYDFKSRFTGSSDYYDAKDQPDGFFLDTNFVPDVRTIKLVNAKERGAGGGHIRFNLAKGTMNSHISEYPVGTYKKAHRHGPGAHVIILGGQGFSLMWPEGTEIKKYPWKEGSMVVPPNLWFHQHFNTGPTPARYLALKYEGTAIRNELGIPKAWISTKLGGDQLDYSDENPKVRKMFEDELAENGVESKMEPFYKKEAEES